MDSTLYEMIFKRRSFHLFRNTGAGTITDAELAEIHSAYRGFRPLDNTIRTGIRILPGEETNCRRGEQYCILLYSEKKDGYLQNIGYLGEQLDLYLVSRDIGTLWFGIGKAEEKSFDGMEFVIMIAIKKVGDASKFRKDMFKSKRKPAVEIWEGEQIPGVTDIIRFAPSACNSQPWLIRNQDGLSVFRYKKPGKRGIMPAGMVSFYNRIDIGILLCFLELCLDHCGIGYERTLYLDAGGDDETNLNAVYRFC